jgi:hypothetical protein
MSHNFLTRSLRYSGDFRVQAMYELRGKDKEDNGRILTLGTTREVTKTELIETEPRTTPAQN